MESETELICANQYGRIYIIYRPPNPTKIGLIVVPACMMDDHVLEELQGTIRCTCHNVLLHRSHHLNTQMKVSHSLSYAHCYLDCLSCVTNGPFMHWGQNMCVTLAVRSKSARWVDKSINYKTAKRLVVCASQIVSDRQVNSKQTVPTYYRYYTLTPWIIQL